MKNRFLEWRDKVKEQITLEQGSETILKRVRQRMLRGAFERYKAKLEEQDKERFAEKRCDYFIATRENRLKQMVYDHWHGFKQDYTGAKVYWGRLFNK
jgi:hypothetical protein